MQSQGHKTVTGLQRRGSQDDHIVIWFQGRGRVSGQSQGHKTVIGSQSSHRVTRQSQGHRAVTLSQNSHQIEATMEKRPMLIRGNGLFSRVAKCTEITARPDLTGIT